MIRSIAKWRRQLIKQGKVRQYLAYAIGEIVLIVVGILIALQISNWNDREKQSRQGTKIVSDLQRDLEGDLAELSSFISNQELIYKSQALMSDWLSSDLAYADSLSYYLPATYRATDYSVNPTNYESLKQLGFPSMESDSLVHAISNLYEVKYPYFIKFTQIYQSFLDELLEQNSKHFNELNYVKPTMRPIDPSRLQSDREYAYHFNTLKNFNYLLMLQGQQLRAELIRTYELLQN